jgi:hypothetical protein
MQSSGKRAEEWIAEAEARLQDKYDRIRSASGLTLAPTFAFEPSLDATEAEYFVRGLDEGLFTIDDEGYAQSPVLPPPSRKGAQKRILSLFWRRAGQRYLFREGVCQLATVSALTLKYGWCLDQIQMEPTLPDLPHLAWAVDIVLRSADGTVAACCEVKRNDREFDELVTGFRHCCSVGPHRRDACQFAKNHPKYELCATVAPAYFMVASPGREISFRLSHVESVLGITEESQNLIAKGSMEELEC